MLKRIKSFLAREWAMISTKAGSVLVAVSAIAPQYAAFDQRIAWAGAGAGLLLMLVRENRDG